MIKHHWRHGLTALAATFSLAACSLAPSNSQTQEASMPSTQAPVISQNDQRQYQSLKLDNGLSVLLISDPHADKAAAAMNVSAGSQDEPSQFPGLAHYLEHMLFLGTETYPDADAYQQFVAENGGSRNAFTASTDTNYYFDIDPRALAGGLDRFSHFFIDPLFTPDYMAREVNAVNSEYSSKLRNDGRRQLAAIRQAVNPEHPFSRFSAGNNETLPVQDPKLREAMLDFYQAHYRAGAMHLVVYGPQSMDQLQQWVKQDFADIPAGQGQQANTPKLFRDQDLPAELNIKPLKQLYQLQLLFPIPDPVQDYTTQPVSYLANLIGHEGEGSILAWLKQKGWASSLSAGSQFSTHDESMFGINIELTAEGDQHIDEITAAVFDYIKLIRQQGVEQWRYEEQAQLAAQSFRFMEPSEPIQAVSQLAMQMARVPMKDVVQAPYLFKQYQPERIRAYLSQLTPEKLLRVHVSPDVKTDDIAPWFPADYSLTHEALNLPASDAHLALPKANPYVADDLSLVEPGTAMAPKQLNGQPGLSLWHATDTSFAVPRAQVFVSLQSPIASTSLKSRVLSNLLADWVLDEFNAPGYPARLAGLGYDAYPHARGLTLTLRGYNQRQPILLKNLLKVLTQDDIKADQFERIKQRQLRQLRNAAQDPLARQMMRALTPELIDPAWSESDKYEALEAITLADLKAYRPQLLSQLHIQMLAMGNLSTEDAKQLATQVRQTLDPQLTKSDIDTLKLRQIPAGVWHQAEQLDHNDKAVLLHIQGRNNEPEETARMLMLTHLQQADFFNSLRTEQQLGYVVFASPFPVLDTAGALYLVQSPNTDAAEIARKIRAFMVEDQVRINQLNENTFKRYKESLLNNLLREDQRLSERGQRMWRAVAMGDTHFDRRERIVQALKDLTLAQFQSFYTDVLANQRGKLWLGTPVKEAEGLPGHKATPEQWPIHEINLP